jgi:hypothetical protein
LTSSIQKIITESLKDNRSLEVKAVNEMMKIQLESLLESIHKTKQSTCNGTNEPVGDAENIVCIKCKSSMPNTIPILRSRNALDTLQIRKTQYD